MVTAGIDIGSTTCKVVLLDENSVIGRLIVPTRGLPADQARESFSQCCKENNIDQKNVQAIITTGYGRHLANFGDMVITEIKACKNGAVYTVNQDQHTDCAILDVGGQDTKVITVGEDAQVEDFTMNDKCAAGTGRFLEMLAKKLELTYDEFVTEAYEKKTDIHMNSTCAVFAESEVVSLLARGTSKADIAAAAHAAIVDRIASMIRRAGGAEKDRLYFTGGGARNKALVQAIECSCNRQITIPESPQTIVALGAAVEALQRLNKGVMNENS